MHFFLLQFFNTVTSQQVNSNAETENQFHDDGAGTTPTQEYQIHHHRSFSTMCINAFTRSFSLLVFLKVVAPTNIFECEENALCTDHHRKHNGSPGCLDGPQKNQTAELDDGEEVHLPQGYMS